MKNKKEIRLHSLVLKDLSLQILTSSHITKKYVGWLNDISVTQFTEQRLFKHSFESVQAFVEEKLKSEDDFLFGIFVKDVHIGNIKLGPINHFHKTAEVSFFIGDFAHRRMGYTAESISLVISFAKEKLGLKKMTAGYYQTNTASCNLFNKLGFTIEGTRLNQIEFNGRRQNLVLVGKSLA